MATPALLLLDGALLLAAGLWIALVGYRLLRATLAVVGFVVGAILGGAAGVFLGPPGIVVGAVVGGILGALLLFFLYGAGAVILGAVGGWLLGVAAMAALGWGGFPFLPLVLALAGGFLGLVLKKAVGIVGTAYAGAWMIVTGIHYLARGAGQDDAADFLDHGSRRLVTVLVVAALAAVVQFRANAGRD